MFTYKPRLVQHYTDWKMSAVVAFSLFALPALAFEPFKIDLNQKAVAETSRQIDHLFPVHESIRVPEFMYLIQYWAQTTTDDYRYVVLSRDQPNGRYYVEQGDIPRANLHSRPYRFKTRAEISSETSGLICEYWVNMLLETRYDRKALPYMPQETLYVFSAFVAPAGRLHGCISYPAVSEDMPPYWMIQAGEALFEFVTKSHDEARLAAIIRNYRDTFYKYKKAHACP